MAHFGVVTPAFYSHVRAMEALSMALLERGHRITFFHRQDARAFLKERRIAFHALGVDRYPAGSLTASLKLAANPGNIIGLRRVIGDMAQTSAMLCRELPDALRQLQIDCVLADQMEAAGGLVAEALSIPFVSVACALPVNRESGVPLPVMSFAAGHDERTLRLCEGSTAVYDWLMTPHRKVIAACARQLGLSPRSGLHDCLSPLLQLSQTVPGFEFERRQLPTHFHHVGPLRAALETGRDKAGAPELVQINPRKPFIFASLGTLQGERFALFRRIAQACRQLDAQLLVAHCGGLDARQAEALKAAGASWVCEFADQQAVLARADAVVSHAGLNTVMDAISAGTPILAMPIAFDQPGVAARLVHAGVGLRASARWASPASIAATLRRLLGEPLFAQRCKELAGAVHNAGGAARAADLVEAALSSAQANTGAQRA